MIHSALTLTSEQIYRLLLWTPWNRLTSEKLPGWLQNKLSEMEDEFIESCFVKPPSFPGDPSVYESFLSMMDSGGDTAIVVSSYAGVGKSTFVHAALIEKKLHSDALVFDVMENISLPKGDLWKKWLNDRRDQLPLTEKIVRLLLCKIYHILRIHSTQNLEECESIRKEHLLRIYNNYKKYFAHPNDERIDLLLAINSYCNERIDYISDPHDLESTCYVETAKSAIYNMYTKSSKSIMGLIGELLETLSAFALCEAEDIKSVKRVIFFDNIEHFLDDRVIFDTEIHDLITMLNGEDGEGEFTRKQNAEYSGLHIPISDSRVDTSFLYSDHFPIVLAVREYHALPLFQGAQTINSADHKYIKLNNQISLAKIIEKKCEFLKNIFPDINKVPTIKMIKMVLNDTEKERGIVEKLSQMFSYNKRRSLLGLISALHFEDDNGISHSREEIITQYTMLMKRAKELESDSVKAAYFNGSRQLIYRILFDSIAYNREPHSIFNGFFQQCNMFDTRNEAITVRQILLVLSRHPIENRPALTTLNHQKAVMPLSDLVETLFIEPHMQGLLTLEDFARKNDNKLKLLARKLWSLSLRSPQYRWCPLVLLMFNMSGKLDHTSILKALRGICNGSISEYSTEGKLLYGVKTTFAGRAFVEFSPSFEFFSARFFPRCDALFSKNSVSETKKTIKHIENMQKRVSDCIDSIVAFDKAFLEYRNVINYNNLYSEKVDSSGKLQNDNVHYLYRAFDFTKKIHVRTELTHPDRIIINHIGYIANFRLFIIDNLLHPIAFVPMDGKNTLNNMSEYKNYHAANTERFVSSLIEKFPIVRNNSYDNSIKRIKKAVDYSLAILNVIEKYIDKLEELTNIESGNPPQFLIGGKERSRIHKDVNWGDRGVGYITLRKKLNEMMVRPLTLESFNFSVNNE